MALTFTGSPQTLSRTNAVLSTYPISFAAWVNQTANAGDQAVIGIAVAGNVNLFMLDLNGGVPRASVKFQNTFVAAASSGGTITLGIWYHLTAVFSSSSSRVIYVNGLNKGSNTVSGTPTGVNSTLIGSIVATTFFRGSIAFPSIWNIGLIPTDIQGLFSGADPRLVQPDNLVSFACLVGRSPEPDIVLPSGWTATGSPTVTPNPRIFSL
jgi:hypothetical protein